VHAALQHQKSLLGRVDAERQETVLVVGLLLPPADDDLNRLTGRVKSIFDGLYRNLGPTSKGVLMDMGATVVFDTGTRRGALFRPIAGMSSLPPSMTAAVLPPNLIGLSNIIAASRSH
jgi:hypothetical protein